MAALAIPERCPNCGREWPSRFGAHNCNYLRLYVHNNARIIEPGAPINESVEILADRRVSEVCWAAQSADLAGEEGPYRKVLGEIDATIGFLKRFRAGIQALRDHQHKWDDNDYCSICHADGRA